MEDNKEQKQIACCACLVTTVKPMNVVQFENEADVKMCDRCTEELIAKSYPVTE